MERLEREGETVTLISRYGLDAKPYNEILTDVTWETCTLKAWLNGDFYNAAFSDREKSKIVKKTISNTGNPYHGAKGVNDTPDYVWLLSKQEAKDLFASDEARRCRATAYAKANGVYVNYDNGWWWLRRRTGYGISTAYVSGGGSVGPGGDNVTSGNHAVRPVIVLRLS